MADFDTWRKKVEWPRAYCPTCGTGPVLAALTPKGEGRQRSLIRGQRETAWPAPRFGRPHCGTKDEPKLAIFELDDEADVRLDVCNNCKGYLKTWAGPREIAPFLPYWATLHADAMAAERVYLRLGASSYEL